MVDGSLMLSVVVSGVTIRMLDLRSKVCELDYQSGRYKWLLPRWVTVCGELNHLTI